MQPYELTGNNWRLPVMVDWHDVVAEVSLPNMPFLKAQRTVLEEKLNSLGDYREGKWWVLKSKLERTAVPSIKTDPEQIVEWCVQNIRVESGVVVVTEFVRGYLESPYALLPDPKVTEMIWLSFCKYALHRLINERKPVQMFFATIYPLMMRVNWKEIALRRENNGQDRTKRFEHQISKIIKRKMVDHLCSPGMSGYDEEQGVADWTLEIVPERAWESAARKLEEEVKRKRKIYYGTRVGNQLKAQLTYALEVYSAFLKKAAHPYLLFRTAVKSRAAGVQPARNQHVAKMGWHGKGRPGDPVYPVGAGKNHWIKVDDQADAEMPELPGVRSEPSELREPGSDVAEQRGPGGTDGMPVLDAVESE